MAPTISFVVVLTPLKLRMPGCMTTPPPPCNHSGPLYHKCPCASVPFLPSSSSTSTLSTMCPTVLVPVASTFSFHVIIPNALLVPNPISTSASLPPRFHVPSSNQPPTPLYPFCSPRLFDVAVNLHLKL